MKEIYWRNRGPIEATISELVVDQGPGTEHYSVLQSERGKRVGGRRFKGKGEKENVKVKIWKSLRERKNEL